MFGKGPSETAIQRAILNRLAYEHIWAWRSQPTPVPIRRGNKIIALRKVDPHLVGMPDIMAIVDGQHIGIEVKTKTGKQSPEQKRWQDNIIASGGIYILARCVEDVERVLGLTSTRAYLVHDL